MTLLICRRPLLFITDALGAAGIALIFGGIVVGVVLPLQSAVQAGPGLRADAAAADTRYEAVTARNRSIADTIRRFEAELAELTGGHHSETGEFLEYVSVRCAACGLRLEQVSPQGVVVSGEQRSWDAQLRARGAFSAFPRLLAEIESWSPFVQIRELSVVGPPQGTLGDCQFTWTVRVSSLPAATTPSRPPP